MRVRTWDSLPKPNFVKKNRLRGYYTFGQIYTENYKFQQFLRCKFTFQGENSEIWRECTDLARSPALIL